MSTPITSQAPDDRTTRPSPVSRMPFCAWALVLLVTLGLEWLLVQQFYTRELLPTYPRMYDQAGYLARAVDIFVAMREQGLWRGLLSTVGWSAPQGQLIQVETALAFWIAGPGRLSALAINFLHFALLQVTFLALGRAEGRPMKGLAFAGLAASAGLIVTDAGALVDFRLDFAAFVLLAVVGCAVVRARGFRLRGWSVIVGLLTGWLGLTRVISFIFVCAGAGLFAVLLLWPVWRNRWEARTRFVNLLCAGAAASVLMAPAILAQWRSFIGYYIHGHTSNEGPLRAMELGIHGWSDHLLFYAHSVVSRQTGAWFLGLAVALLLLAWRGWPGTTTTPDERHRPGDLLATFAFFASVAGCTYFVLTVDIAKSPVVGGQFVALLLPLLWTVTQRLEGAPRLAASIAPWQTAAYAVVFLLGQVTFARPHTGATWLATPPAETAAFMGVADDIAELSRAAGVSRPVLSFDELTDFFHVSVFKVLAFERRGVQLHPQQGLGAIKVGFEAIPLADAQAEIRRSDFALIGVDRDRAGREIYPLNQSLRQLAPQLHAEAMRVMVPLRDVSFFGRRLTFFMKPMIGCDPNSQDWVVASEGLHCQALGTSLARRPRIRLRGTGPFNFVGAVPGARGVVTQGDRTLGEIPCAMRLEPAENMWLQPYELTCDASGLPVDGMTTVTLRIDFDRSFVPREHGVNQDGRQLVMRRPEQAELEPAATPRIAAPPADRQPAAVATGEARPHSTPRPRR